MQIYSWRTWENHAKTMAFRGLLAADAHAGNWCDPKISNKLTLTMNETDKVFSLQNLLQIQKM